MLSGIYPVIMVIGFVLIVALAFISYRQHLSKKVYSSDIRALQQIVDDRSACLEQVNEERDWLIKEIHHRVKNNLQIVISLLNTQSAYLSSEEAREAIKNSQHRMYAISLIHQKLYQADSLSTIDIPLYISELVTYLKEEYDVSENITFKMEMVPLNLDVAYAVPLGLIINEAISNTLKFAFPESGPGQLTIRLESADQVNYLLEIADNGIGLPGEFDIDRHDSLGTSLMAGLSTQLRGVFNMKNDDGVVVTLAFRQSESVKYNLAAI